MKTYGSREGPAAAATGNAVQHSWHIGPVVAFNRDLQKKSTTVFPDNFFGLCNYVSHVGQETMFNPNQNFKTEMSNRLLPGSAFSSF